MRIVFMGTPEFSVPSLEKLAKHHEIIMVYTQPDRPGGRGHKLQKSPVRIKAEELGLPVRTPEKIRKKAEIEYLKLLQPDLMITIAYGQILPQSILDIAPCFNAHASLLPFYRGASPMQEAILQGDEISGVTIIRMDAGMDTGDIVMKKQIPILGDMISDVHDKLSILSAELLDEMLTGYSKISAIPQDDTKASYTRKITKEDGILNPEENAEILVRKVRAYNPWPGTWITIPGHRLGITQATSLAQNTGQKPGTVTEVSRQGINVQTGNGQFVIEKVKLPGKREMTVTEFLNGHTIQKEI